MLLLERASAAVLAQSTLVMTEAVIDGVVLRAQTTLAVVGDDQKSLMLVLEHIGVADHAHTTVMVAAVAVGASDAQPVLLLLLLKQVAVAH